MDEFKKYLADQILSEEKIVTYRSLSRALKVHVNTAKGMLYEFHRSQNGMRPGTIHATYLVYGIQKAVKVEEDGDVEMSSSPPDAEPLSDEVTTHSLILVPGDRLKDVLATYEEVSSFHIYSLARHPTTELQMLADITQQIKEQSAGDSTSMAETYGTITNPNVRKRDRQGRPVPAAASAAPATKSIKDLAPSVAKPASHEPKTEPAKQDTKTSAKDAPSSTAGTKKQAPPAALKKSGSSGIMSSFAKAAAKVSTETTEAPKRETPAALSDDGEDDEDIPAARSSANPGRKSRKDREAELKQMMEESDEDEPEEKEAESADDPMEEAPEPEAQPEPEPTEVVSSTGDGRRRGKRRVMKKKQIMDDQGYLVTIQEPAWEEFSEDEAPPPPSKAKSSSTPSSGSQPSKGKKAAPKGQGNIMSFFAKK
ncbi:DNA polymerase subunit Cdc27 [Colletotrichum graminicola M1.001]|uniref:DNA polymerase delta subunit 3 n=1 Tax=Colletotrichum graminicola (strain M1.001 / M2 / FGSC 10212) TaxID=645133 RepID=E3QIL1_COLGM|nr:DNA polymerase subunit Cdc27 [Colletotrichum graminicola M1.001]EFQ30621.1 DNA polymerase subunit Cdc27 [Colletotrichum graminicola M1.001]